MASKAGWYIKRWHVDGGDSFYRRDDSEAIAKEEFNWLRGIVTNDGDAVYNNKGVARYELYNAKGQLVDTLDVPKYQNVTIPV